MKWLPGLAILCALLFCAACGDVDDTNKMAQEQQQRSMYGTSAERQQMEPPPGDAAPAHEPVPGELPDER